MHALQGGSVLLVASENRVGRFRLRLQNRAVIVLPSSFPQEPFHVSVLQRSATRTGSSPWRRKLIWGMIGADQSAHDSNGITRKSSHEQ